MKRVVAAAVIIGAGTLLIASYLAGAGGGDTPVPADPPATQPDRGRKRTEVIRAGTADAFVAAIGSDREIRLAAGEYVLTNVKDRRMDSVRWDRKFDGLSMTVRNVKNLSVVGEGDKPVRLIVRPGYVFVLNFETCDGVRLENLTMGHAPRRGSATVA